MLGNIFTASCLFSLNIVVLTLAAAFRLLPSFVKAVRFAIQKILVFSYRFYEVILEWIAPYFEHIIGINIHHKFPRMILSIFFSLAFGMLILWITNIQIAAWNIGLCILHGLVVGLVWEDFNHPDEFQIGVQNE